MRLFYGQISGILRIDETYAEWIVKGMRCRASTCTRGCGGQLGQGRVDALARATVEQNALQSRQLQCQQLRYRRHKTVTTAQSATCAVGEISIE